MSSSSIYVKTILAFVTSLLSISTSSLANDFVSKTDNLPDVELHLEVLENLQTKILLEKQRQLKAAFAAFEAKKASTQPTPKIVELNQDSKKTDKTGPVEHHTHHQETVNIDKKPVQTQPHSHSEKGKAAIVKTAANTQTQSSSAVPILQMPAVHPNTAMTPMPAQDQPKNKTEKPTKEESNTVNFVAHKEILKESTEKASPLKLAEPNPIENTSPSMPTLPPLPTLPGMNAEKLEQPKKIESKNNDDVIELNAPSIIPSRKIEVPSIQLENPFAGLLAPSKDKKATDDTNVPKTNTPPETIEPPLVIPTVQEGNDKAQNNPSLPPLSSIIGLENKSDSTPFNDLNGNLTISFLEGKNELKPEAIIQLNKLVSSLKKNDKQTLKVIGFIGSNDGTNDLSSRSNSLKKVITIRNYLVNNGIDAERITVQAGVIDNNKPNNVIIESSK